tara:strand:+ start:447 stop:620 length:174 start_codon:yes stop_codon:yes gene_type:complete
LELGTDPRVASRIDFMDRKFWRFAMLSGDFDPNHDDGILAPRIATVVCKKSLAGHQI